VRNDCDHWSLPAIVQRHESRRLQPAIRRESVIFADHPGMQPWQERHADREHEQSVGERNAGAQPPSGSADTLENDGI
jgi:hypothetical protein